MPPYQNAVADLIILDDLSDDVEDVPDFPGAIVPGLVLRIASLEPITEPPVVTVTVEKTVEIGEIKETEKLTISGPADQIVQILRVAEQVRERVLAASLEALLEIERKKRIDKLNQEFFQKMQNAEDWLTAPWHLAPDRYGTPLVPAPRVTCHHAGSIN